VSIGQEWMEEGSVFKISFRKNVQVNVSEERKNMGSTDN